MTKYYPMFPTRKLCRMVWTSCLSKKKIPPSNLTDVFEDISQDSRRSNAYNHWLIVLVTILMFYYTYNSSFFMSYPSPRKSPLKASPVLVHRTSTAKPIPTSTIYLATVDDLDNLKRNVGNITRIGNSIVYREMTDLKIINTSYSIGFNINDVKKKSNSVSSAVIRPPSRNKIICTNNHTGFGNVKINKTNFKLVWVDKEYPEVKTGGYYSPPNCNSRHKVAIIVPYRNREVHLSTFLFNIHPFLMKQQIEYRIFVVEQAGRRYPFNKGRLYNAAFIEVQKLAQWKCFIFHDVDLLPMDNRILYTCPTWPRHMCASVIGLKHIKSDERFSDFSNDFSPRYRTLFGGVTALTADQYSKANGYSNTYWSWGGEDNDMFWRLKVNGYGVVRYNKSIARYTMLSHTPTRKNKYRYALLKSAGVRYKEEGLSTVDYKLIRTEDHHLYTHYLVDVNPYRENITQMTIAWINTYVTFGLGNEVFNKR